MKAGCIGDSVEEGNWNAVPEDMRSQVVPIVEVAFGEELWWSMSEEISLKFYENMMFNLTSIYCWDRGEQWPCGVWYRERSNRYYTVDLKRKVQTNLYNGKRSAVRLVWAWKPRKACAIEQSG